MHFNYVAAEEGKEPVQQQKQQMHIDQPGSHEKETAQSVAEDVIHKQLDQLEQLSDSQLEISFDLFHGFNEPFSSADEVTGNDPISVGSEDWCKGLAKDSDGRFVHVTSSN